MRAQIFVLAIGVLAITATSARADGQKLVVVVAKGSRLTTISKSELKRCFVGESVTVGDKALVPFNSEPTKPARAGFDAAVLGMSASEVGRFWVDRKVRGQSSAPRALPSFVHVVKVVAKFPNAISYVPVDQLTPELQPVAVDGISYTDPRYSIKER